MATIESAEGRYEVWEGEYGRTYRWRLECVLVGCDCGELTTIDRSETICPWCDADHAAIFQEELVDALWSEDEVVPLRRSAGDHEEAEALC